MDADKRGQIEVFGRNLTRMIHLSKLQPKEQLHREVGASGALVLCLRYLVIPREHRQDLQLVLFSWQDKQDIFITLTKVEKELQAPAPSPPPADKPRQRPARSGKASWLSKRKEIGPPGQNPL